MEQLTEFWENLGPLGPCGVLFLIGLLLVFGFLFNWQWLYPRKTRNYDPGIRRILTLIAGIVMIACSILFYIYRDMMYWQ